LTDCTDPWRLSMRIRKTPWGIQEVAGSTLWE
jgi:hypothetical protein